jgi:multiple sugar transport system substrate-binding protein
MQHDWAYITQWANRNQLLDLDPYVKNGTIDASKIPASALAAGRINGKLYAISLGTNAYGFTYDPAVVERAGVKIDSVNWTFKDFEYAALTIYQKTGVKTLPFTPTSPYNVIEYMIRETGKPFYAADGKSLGFTDTTQIKEFFDIQLRLLDAGALYSPEESYITTTMEEGPFAKGLTWNEYVYINQLIAQQAANGRPIAEALIPHINGTRQRIGEYLKPSQFISITAQSKNPDLAAKVLNFYVNNKEANAILLAERGVPVPTDIRDYLYTLVDPSNKMAFDFITLASDHSSAIDPPDPAPAGEVMAFIRDLTLQVLTKKVTSANATTQFMTGCNRILSGN